MSAKLNAMWAAMESHKPLPEYAEAWGRMCRERTIGAANEAEGAAMLAGGVDAENAAFLAGLALRSMRDAAEYAKCAIDAIRG